MTLQRQRHVSRRHAAAVIGHLDPLQTAGNQGCVNSRRAGVYGIFDEFLQRRSGSFNHFTGCDAIDEMFGQTAY